MCTLGDLSRLTFVVRRQRVTVFIMGQEASEPSVAAMERELRRMTEERHELFARLAQLEAERAAQTLELLTMAAHELRTPLQSLLMGTDLMVTRVQNSAEECARDWLLSHLQRQQMTLKRLEQLMESWLCAPEVRRGTLPVVRERLDLAEAVRTVVARYGDDIDWAGCSLTLSLQPVVGSWDRVRMEAVLANLLSNAIKYGAGRPIWISLEGTHDRAIITVRDEGIGVAPADQERIFQRFERVSTTSRVPGFGVGLWMSRALVRSIGGTIRVNSVPGHGSAFIVDVPRTAHD
jgi:signal transduction histidine kinase